VSGLRLSLSCGDYDRTRFLIDGTVRAPGLDLTVIPLASAERHARFTRYLEFDVCELQIAVYLGWKSRGVPVTAIPVFPHRKFCHGNLVVRHGAGIERPEDLRGKRVGIQAYFNPVALWMRGVLQHEFGVPFDSISWVTNAPEQVTPWEPPAGLRVERTAGHQRVEAMLAAGDLDAYMLPDVGAGAGEAGGPARRLWPNYRAVEADYFRRTGIFPIRHTVVVKDAILQREPWVAQSLLRLFEEAKHVGFRHVADQRRSHLAWYGAELEEEREILGLDPWPYSISGNRVGLETLLDYAFEQRLTDRRLDLAELFSPNTFD
jgi:4,5-dihydroxyphthalate decarboxylase